ncbi:CPCC family cysteine-rich protein [Mucilaginibacter calamicampi]|uniref:CPCC family cysteine-rich protein n=1 Tax=Mucilaginibacter calamicampi TaxID=1302352 RepID=A0ABW2Z3X3_9SPHI
MDNKNNYGRKQCACCGHYTITEIKETCPVCFWEEDSYQEKYIDDSGGPNNVSLRQAVANYKKMRVIEERFVNDVRPPQQDELGSVSK